MNIIFNELEKYCYDLFYGGLEISKLEEWAYNSKELEDILNQDDYLELISLNFKNRNVKYEIEKIINKYIDYGKFQRKLVLSLLYAALSSRADLPDILRNFYDMYCHGYYFFEDLGLGYGLTCEVPPNKYRADTWEELNEEEKNEVIDSFFPQLENDIKRAIDWIENDRIVLTGTKNEMDRWEFIDNMNEEERKSTVWFSVSNSNNTRSSVKKNILWERSDKKWWEFWRR